MTYVTRTCSGDKNVPGSTATCHFFVLRNSSEDVRAVTCKSNEGRMSERTSGITFIWCIRSIFNGLVLARSTEGKINYKPISQDHLLSSIFVPSSVCETESSCPLSTKINDNYFHNGKERAHSICDFPPNVRQIDLALYL